jgi:hypothetical protein
MLKHLHLVEFRKAAEMEFNALLEKGTFEYIEKSKVDDIKEPILNAPDRILCRVLPCIRVIDQ